MKHPRTPTVAHWGVYEVEYDETAAIQLHPFAKDPDPSPIGLHMLRPTLARRPAARAPEQVLSPRRGVADVCRDPWGEALIRCRRVARVKREFGNKAIFGGSYGWSSAGRFHHAQSQLRRFLNSIGGFVRHKDDYSVGAALVLMPHIVGPLEELLASHTSWEVLAAHCELFVTFGGVPRKNSQINAGGAAVHRIRSGLFSLREAGVRQCDADGRRSRHGR
jgi:biotin/methionine sulfoxide reductase